MYKIKIDGHDEEVVFTNFKSALEFCEHEFGYEGDDWDEVVESNDFYLLEDFLNGDGVFAEVIKI